MAEKSARNSKIELLRFLFCLCVLFYHISLSLYDKEQHIFFNHFTFFSHGYLGVEFFFVLSGFFLAKSAKKASLSDSQNTVTHDSFRFMTKKITSIFPYHIIAFFAVFAVTCITKSYDLDKSINLFFKGLPDFFLLSMSGIPCEEINVVIWYLSSMLICMSFIYPLCRSYYEKFSKIAAPVIALFIIGYLCHTNPENTLSTVRRWDTFTYVANFRATAEILLGIFCFEVSSKIKNIKFSKSKKILLSMIEAGLYILCFAYIISDLDNKYDSYFLFAIAAAITITLSNAAYGDKLFNNKFIYFLGKFSLPVYLSQQVFRLLAKAYLDDVQYRYFILFVFGGTIVLALFVKTAGDFILKQINKKSAYIN